MDEEKNHGTVINAGKTTCACGPGCNCGCGPKWHGHRLLRVIIAFFILFFAFAVGVKVGEFKVEFSNLLMDRYNGYSGMMQNQQGSGYGYGYGDSIPATGMMQYPASTSSVNVQTTP